MKKYFQLFICLTAVILPHKAWALLSCSICCNCDKTQESIVETFATHRTGFLLGTYWDNIIHPALRGVVNTVNAAVIAQSASLGAFLEAQNNVDNLRSLQKAQSQSVREFQPSEQVCRFGSLGSSLAASESIAKTNQQHLAKAALSRSLGTEGLAAQSTAAADKSARLSYFCAEHADPADNNGALELMCGPTSRKRRVSVPLDTQYNKGSDYTSTIDLVPTIEMNLEGSSEGRERADQDNVILLGQNLYGSTQLSKRPTERALRDEKVQLEYLKSRSLYSIRNIAENSYAAIAAMRSKGDGVNNVYFKGTLKSLGLSDKKIQNLLRQNPSYFSQMELLTKKLYQSPLFYVNLMDGQTNVKRQTASMEGLQLMQDRDIYQSVRRSEMLLAMLVQMQARKLLKVNHQDINTSREQAP